MKDMSIMTYDTVKVLLHCRWPKKVLLFFNSLKVGQAWVLFPSRFKVSYVNPLFQLSP